jgi:hypothetical protein
MMPQDSVIQELLLDYALERLDDATRRDIDRRITDSPELAEQLGRIQRTLAPLQTWAAPPSPAGLVGAILDRIERSRALQPAVRLVPPPGELRGRAFRGVGVSPAGPSLVPPPGELRAGGRRPILSLREVVALAACILFFVGVFVPSLSNSRQLARRVQCGANLASLFTGLQSYAQANSGYLPNTGLAPGVNWLSTSPNRRNLYVLIRLRYVEPQVMVCPSRPDHRPMPADQVSRVAALPDRKYFSYDMQNVAGSTCNLQDCLAVPVVSDTNPLFEGGRFNRALDPRQANTIAHRARGQNVLWTDGRVVWSTSPITTVGGDNIWTTQNAGTYEGTEVPAGATDAFLIP